GVVTTGSGGSGGAAGSGTGGGSGGAIGTGGSVGTGGTGVSTGEMTACATPIPTLPAYSALTANTKLPDPFKSLSGTRIAAKADGVCRRAEIMAQAQLYELGTKPAKPSTVTGALNGTTLAVTVGNGGSSISFNSTITKPSGTGPFPALITIGG